GHLPLRCLDDGARHKDVSVRVGLRGRDRVAAPEKGLLHESGFPVVLGAAVRLDVHLHESDGRTGRYFRVARRLPHNSYPRPRRSSRHGATPPPRANVGDRKSTRLNSSHGSISYAVFCLKKKNTSNYMYYSNNSLLYL